jgi:signal transduction histidine kinase
MVAEPGNQRRTPLVDDENRAGAEMYIARVRVAITAYCLVLTGLGGTDFRHYPGSAWAVAVAFSLYAWGTLAALTLSRRSGSVSRATPWATTALDTAFILVFAAVSGAAQSPIVPILILDVMAAAIRFGLQRALFVTGVACAGLVAVILAVPEPDLLLAQRLRAAGWWTAHLVVGAVMAGMLSNLVDAARRRRAEAEAEMESQQRRSAEERKLRQRLEVVDEARKDFLHAIAHDFRTPIASMEALARALTPEAALHSPEEQAMILDLMQSHARHLGSMLREVREVAVTESLTLDHQLDLADVYMPELIWEAGTAAAVPNDRLVVDIEPGLNVLRTDAHKLQRILANLLDNSVKHSPPDETVGVRLGRHDGTVELAVLDRGPGIPAELSTRAFEKFVGFGPNRSWGLGMWIVSRFVWALGGSVAAEPRPGGGLMVLARFPETTMLPVRPDASTPARRSGVQRAGDGQRQPGTGRADADPPAVDRHPDLDGARPVDHLPRPPAAEVDRLPLA